MSIFKKLFGDKQDNGPYRSPAQYASSRSGQLTKAPQTVALLRNYGVTADRELKLEYFFYTNSADKAAALSKSLADLGYEGGYGESAGGRNEFVITGWTSPMPMDDQTVREWTGRMCDTGSEHDCEFDGWGTTPEQ